MSRLRGHLAPWAILGTMTLAPGCGGAPRAAADRTIETESAPVTVDERRLVVVRRPTGQEIAVAVWFDAGTLDAENASVALVAAELARGDTLEATTLPDGMVFRRTCRAAELASCLASVATALAEPDTSQERVEAARAVVAARRERALGDRRREAETLATSAALGMELSPLGSVEDVVTERALAAFVDAHLGSARSLWVVVGDVSSEEVTAALRGARRRDAHASRGARRPDDSIPIRRTEEAYGPAVWALARRVADEPMALGLARAWSLRVGHVVGARVAAFPTRAGWIVLASGSRDELAAELVQRLRGAIPRPGSTIEPDVDEGGAWSITDRIGQRWIAEPRREVAPRDAVAVVGVDAESRAAAMPIEGSARTLVIASAVRMPGVAPALAWALPGPSDDGAASYGATAIAAELLERLCVPNDRVALRDGMVVVSARGEEARALASAWTDCVALDEPTEGEVEDARRAALSTLTLNDARRDAAARAISPGAPGIVAPMASATALADVSSDDVLARWRAWRSSGRWAAVGDVPEVAPPEASLTPLTSTLGPPPSIEPHVALDVSHTELVIAGALSGCGSVARARAIEEAWSEGARARGLVVTWTDAGATRELAWVAVSLQGEPRSLSEWAAQPPPTDDAATEARTERIERALALDAADPSERAAREAIGEREATGCDARPEVRRVWLEPRARSRRR